ncbi:ribonuclease P protein subunit p30 [Athalia rosae]|uniref:ribonuclease P protein subunit p30 n=1 Tax=Athalia rosae TaxID=37344 RepID=UPI0006252F18|nr:ribonuclease P protein subunit p30 [Athalia rosae]
MSFGFCDLCVNLENEDIGSLRVMLHKLHTMGYSTVAINQMLDESGFESRKKKKKKLGDESSPVTTLPNPDIIKDLIPEFAGKLRILSRITFIYTGITTTQALNQTPNLRKYDLYAVAPQTQEAVQIACAQLNADIISINTKCPGLRLGRKLYSQAVERGVHFEIQYSDIIDTATRNFAIHYSHLYHAYGRSKNIIITSGASKPSQIRNPYDIMNLATILGLNETKARASILSQSRYVILRAESRRYGKSVFEIQSSADKEVLELETEDVEEEDSSIDPKQMRL